MSKRTQIIITAIGVLLVCIGLFMPVPSKELTTYSFMADEGYSVIEEYVGGDAYNYIIGASLIGGEIAGTKAQKAIFTVAGLLFICTSMVLADLHGKNYISLETRTDPEEKQTENTSESSLEQKTECDSTNL